MLKKIILVSLAVLLVVMVGGFFWVRSVLGGDGVRTAIADQMTKAIGQPVSIGSISASPYPRVTVSLGDVRIGNPPRIQVSALDIGTDLRALLSRRIEHASLRLQGGRIELPLPPFPGLAATPESSGGSPVELVSIDEIVLNDVQIISGGRTLRGDVEVVPHGQAVTLRKMTLAADGATLNATGEISDVSGPIGEINLKATTLDIDQLHAFANDFSSGAGLGGASPGTPPPASTTAAGSGAGSTSRMNLTVSLDADQAKIGGLTLQALKGRARMTAAGVVLEPIAFGVFGGRYEGSLSLSAGAVPEIAAQATVTGVNVAEATSFAGSPDTVTGRLSGHLEIRGQGTDAASLTNNATGTLRVDVTDGVVKNLGLVQAVVVATSMRSGSTQGIAGGSRDEPFSKLGATLNLSNGVVTTNDLAFESVNLNLRASGLLRLSAATLDLQGRLQLSEALSKQAGQDLVRYTQDQGRVTLPASITGPASAPSVRLDIGDMAKRAVTNAAKEEASKRLKGGLSGLLGR